jgi:hypothetical protein
MIALSLAVIAGAVAYVMDGMSREAVARLKADAAVAAEAEAGHNAKAEKAAADKALAEKRAAEANAAAAEDSRAAAEADKRAAADAKIAAEANERAKKAASEAARASRDAAVAERAAAEAKLKIAEAEKEKAKSEENALALKAQAEADRLAAEKLRSEKVIAEAKALELMKIDFETLERDLMEFKQELDERERALKPEKTIADLSWVGDSEDMEVGEHGEVRAKKKREYRPEDDPALPRATRALAAMERAVGDSRKKESDAVRARIVGELEGLYVSALRDGRVVDAGYYRKSLKSLYPDWEFKGEQNKTEQSKSK